MRDKLWSSRKGKSSSKRRDAGGTGHGRNGCCFARMLLHSAFSENTKGVPTSLGFWYPGALENKQNIFMVLQDYHLKSDDYKHMHFQVHYQFEKTWETKDYSCTVKASTLSAKIKSLSFFKNFQC